MLAFIKKFLLLLGFLFLSAFIQFAVFFMGYKTFVEKNTHYVESGIGAFMGAFFAFMFLIVERIYERVRERRKKHRDALVRLEHVLHEFMALNNDNLLLLNQFADAVKNNIFFFVSFGEFDVNKDALLDLQNIDMINDMFSLNIELSRVNKTLTTICNWYSDLKTAFVDGKISEVAYKENMRTFSEKLKIYVDATILLGEKIEKSLAKVRVLLEHVTMLDRFLMSFSWVDRYPKDFETQCEKELEKIRKEVSKIKGKGQSEIDALKPEEKK